MLSFCDFDGRAGQSVRLPSFVALADGLGLPLDVAEEEVDVLLTLGFIRTKTLALLDQTTLLRDTQLHLDPRR